MDQHPVSKVINHILFANVYNNRVARWIWAGLLLLGLVGLLAW